jgi:hypothetical protein
MGREAKCKILDLLRHSFSGGVNEDFTCVTYIYNTLNRKRRSFESLGTNGKHALL